ncbi:MAG: N-acetyl-gamma-glutamyl-phosphate reductase, partial [Deltaproteobacteria bacterium]
MACRVAVLGASGYTGVELVRLLSAHPEINLVQVTSRQYAGRKVAEVFPSLS